MSAAAQDRPVQNVPQALPAEAPVAELAAGDADIIPPKVYTTTPGNINVSDASFAYSVTDLSIGNLTLERRLLSGAKKPNTPFFGTNMTHNFDIYVAPNFKSATSLPNSLPNRYRPIVHIGPSASGIYAQSTANLATINPNNLDAERSGILTWSGGSSAYYIYTDSGGAVYTFSSSVPAAGVPFNSQRVSQIVFADGRTQVFLYDGAKQLKAVTDTSGYAIVFDYNAAGDVSVACGYNLSQTYVSVASTCSAATLKTSYAYDASRNLTSVTDVFAQVTTYPGNGLFGPPCVKPPGYSVCMLSMSYNVPASITVQTMADGSVWEVHGSNPDIINDPESATDPIDGGNSGLVINPALGQMTFTFTKSSPYSITDELGRTSQYRFTGAMEFDYTGTPFHDGTLLEEVTLPEGNKYLAEYNGPFRTVTKQTLVAKPGSGLANRVTQNGYQSCTTAPGTYQNCAKPIWTQDAKGNRTDYTYAAHGGVLTQMGPAPSAGAARPLKVYTYVQKYAYIKNASGALVPAASPIWLPASETVCQTVAGASPAPVCATGGGVLNMVTTYQYGADGTADNLLLRSTTVTGEDADGTTKNYKSCYGYDTAGNRIWETNPRGTCP